MNITKANSDHCRKSISNDFKVAPQKDTLNEIRNNEVNQTQYYASHLMRLFESKLKKMYLIEQNHSLKSKSK
jgi:hypothetical protein